MTAAAIVKDLLFPTQRAQKPRGRQCSRVIRIPANEDMSGNRLRHVFNSHRSRRYAVISGLRKHRIVPDTDRAGIVAVALRVHEFELIEGDIGRRCWTAKHSPKLLAFRLLER